jgi:hypothetical protein
MNDEVRAGRWRGRARDRRATPVAAWHRAKAHGRITTDAGDVPPRMPGRPGPRAGRAAGQPRRSALRADALSR